MHFTHVNQIIHHATHTDPNPLGSNHKVISWLAMHHVHLTHHTYLNHYQTHPFNITMVYITIPYTASTCMQIPKAKQCIEWYRCNQLTVSPKTSPINSSQNPIQKTLRRHGHPDQLNTPKQLKTHTHTKMCLLKQWYASMVWVTQMIHPDYVSTCILSIPMIRSKGPANPDHLPYSKATLNSNLESFSLFPKTNFNIQIQSNQVSNTHHKPCIDIHVVLQCYGIFESFGSINQTTSRIRQRSTRTWTNCCVVSS